MRSSKSYSDTQWTYTYWGSIHLKQVLMRLKTYLICCSFCGNSKRWCGKCLMMITIYHFSSKTNRTLFIKESKVIHFKNLNEYCFLNCSCIYCCICCSILCPTCLRPAWLKRIDRDRTRTCNPQIRSLVPYPLGHTATLGKGLLAGIVIV